MAVAAEASARLLFFKLVYDPELLARLLVMYFEKGSVADPTDPPVRPSAEGGDEEGGEKEEGGKEEGERDHAKAIGSSVRLSQVGQRCCGHRVLCRCSWALSRDDLMEARWRL